MKVRSVVALQVVVSSLLAACSGAPTKPDVQSGSAAAVTAAVPATPATAATVAPAAKSATALTAGRRKVVKDGQEYYCKRQESTGSRVNATQSCLTIAQLEAQAASGQEFVNDVIRQPGAMTPDSGGGMQTGITP
jgi:hypothetical protein